MGRRKNIFKDLENCVVDTAYALKQCDKRDAEQYKRLRTRYRALKEVAGYVDSYKWMSKAKSIEQLKYIRAAKYDYKLIRENLKMDDRTLRNFMGYCSARLKSKIGSNTIDLLMQDAVGIAMVQYKALTGTYSLDKLLREDVVEKLPQPKFEPCDLKDCKKEIKYLFSNSEYVRDKRLEGLDTNKLAFLRFVIEEDTQKFDKDKCDLVELLLGDGKGLKAYLEKLDEQVV